MFLCELLVHVSRALLEAAGILHCLLVASAASDVSGLATPAQPRIDGGPVRVVMRSYVAARSARWVTDITVQTDRGTTTSRRVCLPHSAGGYRYRYRGSRGWHVDVLGDTQLRRPQPWDGDRIALALGHPVATHPPVTTAASRVDDPFGNGRSWRERGTAPAATNRNSAAAVRNRKVCADNSWARIAMTVRRLGTARCDVRPGA